MIAIHFFTQVWVASVKNDDVHKTNKVDFEFVASNTEVDSEHLSKLFDIVYVIPEEFQSSTEVEQGEKHQEILLADVTIKIRAIVRINDKFTVFVEYDDGKGLKKEKVSQGQELLGYTFLQVERNILLFERDGVKSQYKMFNKQAKR
jgi:hypothetical protein